MPKIRINIITLGCYKNLVDSEELLTQLKGNGMDVFHNEIDKKFDIAIINTCGFIKDAKEESVNTILEYIHAKKEGRIKQVFVFGCLSERYKKELQNEIPEVDQYFGVNNLKDILKSIKSELKQHLLTGREITTPRHYAYLKISEGCDRTCAFCAIPLIRGKHISVPMELIVKQAESLVKSGSKEIILIAQDLSYYGWDLYKKSKLTELVDRLTDIDGLDWLRLHYTYPNRFPTEILDLMCAKTNICKYVDIPFQHISDKVLTMMKRGHTKQNNLDLLEKFRTIVPEMAIRTTLMVGHPGEGKKEFDELMKFVEEAKFDRLGVFTYSEEENTYGAINYKDTIKEKEKNRRAAELMAMQEQISLDKNFSKINQVFKTIIDRKEKDFYVGRTEFDSPEVDNEVLIKTNQTLKSGNFYNIKITDAEHFDLFGELQINNSSIV